MLLRQTSIALGAAMLLVAGVALAQTPTRPGVRVTVTRIEPSGGFTGASFVSIPPSRTTVTAAACTTYEGNGIAVTGAVRRVRLRVASAGGADVPIQVLDAAALPCEVAAIEVTMEDGRVLHPNLGSGTASVVDGVLTGRFTSTIDEDGVPTTVVAEFTLRPRS